MAPKKGSSKSSGGVDPMVLGAAGALAFACVAMLALTGGKKLTSNPGAWLVHQLSSSLSSVACDP